MSNYLSRLAARNLGIADVVYPRVRTFFEPATHTDRAYDGGSLFEQYSVSEKQEVKFESGKKELYDENYIESEQASSLSSDGSSRLSQMEKASEETDGTIVRDRINSESSLSKDPAAESSSDQSPISVRNPGKSSKPFSLGNSNQISTDQVKQASRRIEPPEGTILSEGIARKAMDLNSSPLESESNQKSLDLGGNKQPLHSDISKPDLPGARSEAHYMAHWGVADAQSERQNLIESFVAPPKRLNRERIEPNGRTNYPMNKSLKNDVYHPNPSKTELEAISTKPDGIQQQILPEQQNRTEEENSANKIKIKPNYASLVNTDDILWLDDDRSKRAVSDQLPFPFELRPENVDAEESGRKSSHSPKSLSKATTGRAVQSDSILDGKLERKRFKATRADNARREPPGSFEKADPTRVDREIINKQLKGVHPSSSKPLGKSSPSRDQSSDSSASSDRIIGLGISGIGSPDSSSQDLKNTNISRIGSVIARSIAPLELPIGNSLQQSTKTQSTIRVTIGRVEVRATEPRPAPSAPLRRALPLTNRLSLDEYLKQRSTGQL